MSTDALRSAMMPARYAEMMGRHPSEWTDEEIHTTLHSVNNFLQALLPLQELLRVEHFVRLSPAEQNEQDAFYRRIGVRLSDTAIAIRISEMSFAKLEDAA